MTAASRALALACARRFRCSEPACTVTLPSRVSCVPRWDGRFDVVTVVDVDAQRRHLRDAHRVAMWPWAS